MKIWDFDFRKGCGLIMKKNCKCESGKGFHLSVSIDITKIVKYLCVTIGILAIVSFIAESSKCLMLDDND